MRKGWVAAVALAGALAACGGGGAGSAAATAVTGPDLASKLGCTYSPSTLTMYAATSGLCGQDWSIDTFARQTDQQKWLDVAHQMAGGQYLVGPNWVVTQTGETPLTTAKSALGGDIK